MTGSQTFHFARVSRLSLCAVSHLVETDLHIPRRLASPQSLHVCHVNEGLTSFDRPLACSRPKHINLVFETFHFWIVPIVDDGVEVDGVQIDDSQTVLQNPPVPLVASLSTAEYKLDARVDQAKSVSPHVGLGSILGGSDVTDLPLSPHYRPSVSIGSGRLTLIPQTPDPHLVWLVSSCMLSSLVGPVRVTGPVAVFEPVQSLLQSPCSHVEAEIWLHI